MSGRPEQFAGGALPQAGSSGEVRSGFASSPLQARKSPMGSPQTHDSKSVRVPGRSDSSVFGPPNRTNCLSESRECRPYVALHELDLSPEEKSACGGIAGVVFGEIERCHGHFHVTWECPDCSGTGFRDYDGEPALMHCEITGRCFLIAGLDAER